jgi:hypothetical protein
VKGTVVSQLTAQQNALNFVGDLISLASLHKQILLQVQDMIARNNQNGYMSYLAAQPTYAITAQGTQGTIDGSPNSQNPIEGVNITWNQLNGFYSELAQDYATFLTGSGSVTTENRQNTIAPLLP